MRVDLPSGGWAELRDVAEIRKGHRDRVLKSTDTVDGAFARSIRSADMILALAIEKWSFDLELPSNELTVLDELTIPDYDKLCADVEPWQKALFPDFGGEGVDDPSSPFPEAVPAEGTAEWP